MQSPFKYNSTKACCILTATKAGIGGHSYKLDILLWEILNMVWYGES